MKYVLVVMSALFLAGCAASLRFIDQEDGAVYLGKTGATMGSSGALTAQIEGEQYEGEWIYSPRGGGYTLGTSSATAYGSQGGFASAHGTSTAVHTSASGSGLITMRSSGGSFMRCVFDFNTNSDTGVGQCQRNDGRLYDVMIKR